MKFLIYSVIFISVLVSCDNNNNNNNSTSVSIEHKDIIEKNDDSLYYLIEELIFPNTGVFRGTHFDMSLFEVKKLELSHEKSTEKYTEVDGVFIVKTNSTTEHAEIKYSFDKQGLFFITLRSTYLSERKANYVFDILQKHFTNNMGKGVADKNGFLVFNKKYKEIPYAVALKKNIPTKVDSIFQIDLLVFMTD